MPTEIHDGYDVVDPSSSGGGGGVIAVAAAAHDGSYDDEEEDDVMVEAVAEEEGDEISEEAASPKQKKPSPYVGKEEAVLALANDDGNDHDGDDEEVLEAVVVDDVANANAVEAEDAMVVEAVAVEATPPPPASKKKKKKKKATPTKKGGGTAAKATSAAASSASKKKASKGRKSKDSKKKPAAKKGGGAKKSTATGSSSASKKKGKGSSSKKKGSGSKDKKDGESELVEAIAVRPEYSQASKEARSMLQETVPTLPVALADSQVRSFGRLYIDVQAAAAASAASRKGGPPQLQSCSNPFVKSGALYPIGFSCDRYEFSPVHGRVLKVRCSILDGRKVQEKQRMLGVDESSWAKWPDGPVFRLTWGQGVDEDPNNATERLYNTKIHSAAVIDSSGGSCSHMSFDEAPKSVKPEEGMRARVRFDKDKFYCGSIVAIKAAPGSGSKSPKKKKKKPEPMQISIQYDDGSAEEVAYPDPDVTLLLQGTEEDVDSSGKVELTVLNGKAVTSVVGFSPLEAWGKALIELGLADEIVYDAALEVVKKHREDGHQGGKLQLGKSSASYIDDASSRGNSRAPSPAPSLATTANGEGACVAGEEKKDNVNFDGETDNSEPATEKEKALRLRAESLLSELDNAIEEDNEASVELADARVNLQGPFLCNPFHNDEQSRTAQASWLATAVRKEKTKMGSTGNRKKIVTAMDLLEKNNTLYNTDIEALIEGLPGSEYCSSYVFQAFRTASGGSSLNKQWIHEAQLRREREAMKRLKRNKELQEKEHQELERMKKRKERDDIRDARKRQKLEEEEEKKRARAEERLSRLRVQVEERLMAEASFQREKVISALCRNLAKEFTRRRKAAEIVAAQAVVEAKGVTPSMFRSVGPETLPPLSNVYDDDTLRVWDFMGTFGSFFLERGYITEVPTLDSLQSAIDSLRDNRRITSEDAGSDPASSLTDLAIALCKPLAASLTRILFASLIALNPVLQKDYGAAFFNEVNATKSKEDGDEGDSSHPDILLPVNELTWQDIARTSLLADALGELGYQRHEAAHILRGYRSAGHPNSKESRRLRKAEDIWIALLRQEVELGRDEAESGLGNIVRIDVPCQPLCTPNDFRYFLHNIQSLTDTTIPEIKGNLVSAMKVLQSQDDASSNKAYLEDLNQVYQLIEEIGSAKADNKAVKKVKTACLKLFEKFAGTASNEFADLAVSGGNSKEWPWQLNRCTISEAGDISSDGLNRQRMGLVNSMAVTKAGFKTFSHARENYMEDALLFKEEEKRRQSKGEDDEEDDDDDDEDEDENGDSSAVVAVNEQPSKDDKNGDSSAMEVDNEKQPSKDGKNGESNAMEVDNEKQPSKDDKNGESSAMEVDNEKQPSEDDKNGESSAMEVNNEKQPSEDDKNGESSAMEVDNEKQPSKEANMSVPSAGEGDNQDTAEDSSAVVADNEKQPSKEADAMTSSAGEDEKQAIVVKEDAPMNGTVVSDAAAASKAKEAEQAARIGKATQFDDFCGDIPTAPELIRRCLAVLRAICLSSQTSTFVNPIDPQSNPGYYDTVLRPMCLREAGKLLRKAAEKAEELDGDGKNAFVERTVAEFGRNMRSIEQNTRCYANAGPTVTAMGAEFLRIFERLFLDWVLAPEHVLQPLDDLEDERCVEHHASDEESTVLFCDGCEGKYNINRLSPPLLKVPKGDWYCPRCVSGRWWGQLDPRVGKVVKKAKKVDGGGIEPVGPSFHIRECLFRFAEGENSQTSLMYTVEKEGGGCTETWPLPEVDLAMKAAKIEVPPIRCLEAVAESPGYASGVDFGLRKDLVPIVLNPTVSDSAAQVTLSSSVFRDSVSASGTLLVIDPKEMTANEWLRLLALLTMKCSSSDVIQNVVSKMEGKAAETMQAPLECLGKVSNIRDVLPDLSYDDFLEEDAVEVQGPLENTQGPVAPIAVAVEGVVTSSTEAPKPAPVLENGVHPSVVVEAKAVEVVEDSAPDPVASNGSKIETPMVTEIAPIEKIPVFSAALLEKKRRRKAMEDSIAAYCIKSQLKPTVASFEEDAVSRVADSSLASKVRGLDFASIRCRRKTCDFCGLTDFALGTPLVRVPSEEEWTEMIPHGARNRRMHLIAEIPSGKAPEPDDQESSPLPGKLVALKLRVDGELFSVGDKELSDIADGGMTEFAPRSDVGFESDLRFRYKTGLPFVAGSMSAHECCAAAAHNSRKELMVQRHKDRQAELIEKEAGMTCGRTLEIGRDSRRRSYWKFNSDPSALFVCVNNADDSASMRWHRFGDAESIASVMVCLGKESIVKDLQRSYPEAARALQNGTWTNALLKKRYPRAAALITEPKDEGESDSEKLGESDQEMLVVGGFEPYEIGEDVLVESEHGSLLWEASVTGVSKKPMGPSKALVIDSYRVEYKGWTTHFTEWVAPDRVVEPNENNRLLEEELLEERASSRCGLPTALNFLNAKNYLLARDRARGKDTPLPDFARVAQVPPHSPPSMKTFALMKVAILAVEAALPTGSVDTTENGPWSKKLAQKWRYLVHETDGPARLMQCVIHLEDMLGEDWIKPDVGHLRSCLPARWKAIGDCTPSSLAVRIILLDRSIKYGTVDRKRFSKKKSKKD